MGGKLSRKRKGYDVSDPKETKDDPTATATGAEESAKVEAAALPIEAKLTTEAGNGVEVAVGSPVAAVTEAVKAPEEPKSAPPEDTASAAPEATARVAEEPAPAVEEPAPAVEEPAPVVEEVAPVVEEPAPAAQEPAPAVEEPAPAVEEPAAAEEKAAPVAQEPAPAVDEPAPVAEELVAAEIKAAPVAQELAAAVEEPAPAAVEEPVIATEEPAATAVESTVEEQAPVKLPGATATVVEEPVPIELESEAAPEELLEKEPASAVEIVPEPEVVHISIAEAPKDQEPEQIPETVTEPEGTLMETVVPAAVSEPEPVAEPAAEVLKQAPETEQSAELESEPQQESVKAFEPEPEPEQVPEPEPERDQVLQPEPEQVADAMESETEKQAEEVALEPIVATSEVTELKNVEAESVLETAADEVPTEYQPGEEESVATGAPSTPEASAVPEAAEPVPEIVISESFSANEITIESEEVAKASLEEVPCPEPEVESKMENGDTESPSGTKDVAKIDALPAVNGECTHSAVTQIEECVNGDEKPEEMPIQEQSDIELKKEVNLSGNIQEVPNAFSGMAEGLSTEITQVV